MIGTSWAEVGNGGELAETPPLTGADLRRALEQQEFQLHYQPIVSLDSGQIAGFEALLRWMHPERGMLYPADFLPLAAHTDLVVPLTQRTLHQMGEQMGRWQEGVGKTLPLTVSMNLSAQYLVQGNLIQEMDGLAAKSQIDYQTFRLELTETQIVENQQQLVRPLSQLKDRGVRLIIDDFGSGCSPLLHLARLPVCALKIDQSLVRAVRSDLARRAITAITSLAHGLGLELIAKGVEKEEQLRLLQEIGCEYGQGFYFSPAVDRQAADLLLAEGIQKGRGGQVDVSRLGAFGLFANLGEADLNEIALSCSELAVPAGSIVIREGQVGNRIYLVERGSVAVFKGPRDAGPFLVTLQAPNVIGEMAIVDPERIRTANVKALTPLRVLSIPIPAFLSFLRRFPVLEANFHQLRKMRSAK